MEFTAFAIQIGVVARLKLAIADVARLLGQATAHAAMLLRRQLVPQAATTAAAAQVQPKVHFLHESARELKLNVRFVMRNKLKFTLGIGKTQDTIIIIIVCQFSFSKIVQPTFCT